MDLLARFKPEIVQKGAAAACVIGREGSYELRYVPFEHVTRRARISFVGITPGTTQMTLGYEAFRKAILAGHDDAQALAMAKAAAAFGGKAMRDRMNRMIGHFRVHEVLGLSSPDDVWDDSRGIMHATSVVPHAAFKKERMFSGSFAEIRRVALFRTCFEQEFVSTLSMLSPSVRFVAIGRTPWDALRWCVEKGFLRSNQLLGAFAHPSGSAGSQVDYFLGLRNVSEFHPRDPVLRRLPWLDQARQDLAENVAAELRSRRGTERH
jgi:hypothetical protein